ncbi:MAG: type II and III secretion system protein [Candidatus Stygibacter frigidus]|nr:type II and III secretion system protein [Candidatus Stygibacter frigidus]
MIRSKKTGIIVLFLILITLQLISKDVSSDTISLSRNTTINDALTTIEVISIRTEGKKIYNLSSSNSAIGVPIKNTNWKDALEIICKIHNLTIEERAGTIMISDAEAKSEAENVNLNNRQVKISASVLEINKTVAENIGINWSTIIDGAVNFSGSLAFKGASAVGSDLFQAAGTSTTDSGDQRIQVDALMAILEENQDGRVLAKPSINVDSGEKGYIQVGKDFSIKTVDDAGNTTDQFFSTGVILDVTPTIISDEEGNEAINMKISVERSSAIPGEVSTEITKSRATSSITMYDGEETTIGGLYDKDETTSRGGVPILKDLPWWFLGLRYLFGYEINNVSEKELVIIIKAELIDSVLIRSAKE